MYSESNKGTYRQEGNVEDGKMQTHAQHNGTAKVQILPWRKRQ